MLSNKENIWRMKLILISILAIAIHVNVNARTFMTEDYIITDTLKEVVITFPKIRHTPTSDIYYIDEQKTKDLTSVYDLLGNLPTLNYNSFSEIITYMGNDNISIEVNGVPENKEQLNALPLSAIDRIEVIKLPPVRYAQNGVAAVVRIKLKDDYQGSRIAASNLSMLAPNNNDDFVANEQPYLSYLYSSKKLELNLGYGMGSINWNYPLSYSIKLPDGERKITKTVGTSDSNDNNNSWSHHVNMGLKWHINQRQFLYGSVQSSWMSEKHRQSFDGVVTKADGSSYDFFESSYFKDRTDMVRAYSIYENNISSSFALHVDMGYETSDGSNRNGVGGESHAGTYRNHKRYYNGTVDLSYKRNEELSFNLGYTGMFRSNRTTNNEVDYNYQGKNTKVSNSRNSAYIFGDYQPRENILIHAGTGLAYYYQSTEYGKYNKWKVQPQLSISFVPNEKVQLIADWNIKTEFPKLYQMISSSSDIDLGIIQYGNQAIISPSCSTFSFQSVLWDKLNFGMQHSRTTNKAGTWYAENQYGDIVSTFVNTDIRISSLFMAYEWNIAKGMSWENTIVLSQIRVHGSGLSKRNTNVSVISKLQWMPSWLKSRLSLEYWHQMSKEPTLQGWADNGQDIWQVGFSKNFLRNMMSLSVNYVPPIHLFVKSSQKTQISTDIMEINRKLNLRTYDNTIMIRVRFNLDTRKKVRRSRDNFDFLDEKKKGRGLL